MSTSTNNAWATPYVSFYSRGGDACIEFMQVPGTGKLSARHFMDINARKNELMDAASDAKRIVLGVDPTLVAEASYIVNNLVCAVMMAERSKVSLQSSTGAGNNITLYFYGESQPVAHSPKKAAAKHHHSSKPKHHGSHQSQPKIHVF